MTGWAAAADRGRQAARDTNTSRRMVTVARYEWAEAPRMVMRPVEPTPSSTKRTVRSVEDGVEWRVKVVADCGHVLHSQVVAGDGVLPTRVDLVWPIGKRKRCPRCPPPKAKPQVPDEDRCVYEMGDEIVRRCPTRGRWRVFTVEADGVVPHAWPLVCERHCRHLVSEGYVELVMDGGADVVVEVPRPNVAKRRPVE